MTTTEPDLYYDPYDFDIDVDPYPLWARMREERPLYYNERYDFFALSRFEDVERAFKDWGTYSSARGTLIELIKADYRSEERRVGKEGVRRGRSRWSP